MPVELCPEKRFRVWGLGFRFEGALAPSCHDALSDVDEVGAVSVGDSASFPSYVTLFRHPGPHRREESCVQGGQVANRRPNGSVPEA